MGRSAANSAIARQFIQKGAIKLSTALGVLSAAGDLVYYADILQQHGIHVESDNGVVYFRVEKKMTFKELITTISDTFNEKIRPE